MTELRTQKPRDPRTTAAAVLRVVERLELDGAAEAVGLSTSLVRKWGDQDSGKSPSFAQAVLLDQAYQRACPGETPPLLALHMDRVGHAAVCDHAGALEIHESIVHATAGLGELARAVLRARDPSGPGGRAVTPGERIELQQFAAALKEHAHAIEDAIEATAPPGALQKIEGGRKP